jgi:CubicO group peptidase (beta-lactamase class C family)
MALLDDAVARRVTPGGVLVIGDAGKIVLEHAFGALTYGGPPVGTDTIYDVASLTKPIVTATLAMILKVDEPRLLSHSSGKPAHRPYWETARGRDEIVDRAEAEPLEYEPGTRSIYSDLGFMILGRHVERAGGERLDRLAARLIFAPLGMRASRFVDLDAGERIDAAPTEVAGIVHDENCRAAGGILGHAGLFSTGPDVSRFAAAMVASWHGDGGAPFDRDATRRALARAGVPGSTWGLGWDHPSETGSSAGERWPKDGAGHLGFTGTSLWIDPPKRRWVVLLTNRVHPTRENQEIKKLRPRLHDLIVQSLC